ncbi:MAG: type II toxin-antitoxin system VapC family toxin [Anaerosomatales bacterium]|nr:type II toxin-antitoxin system VapC family toxin [Anaerosomatales bacterium]
MNTVVLDASVGVKWFRDESGSAEARAMLRSHGSGEIRIVVPSLFVYEFAGVATRLLQLDEARDLWARFLDWRISVREVGDSLMRDAFDIRERYGCTLYDALSPALAAQIGATLCSADRRAHGGMPGAVIIGE